MSIQISKVIRDFAADVREILKENLIAEYLFGSYVTENDRHDSTRSDIDILVLVKNVSFDIRSAVSELASDYALDHGLTISAVIKDAAIWEKNRRFGTLFFQEIQKHGIEL